MKNKNAVRHAGHKETAARGIMMAVRSNAAQTRVLVVEDDEVIRELLVRALSTAGYEVRAAEDGLDALGHLEQELADLVIADINMPTLDGFAMAQYMREYTHTRRVPVIVISAKERPANSAQCARLGIHRWIAKPFDIDELIATVQDVLMSSKVD